MDIQKCFSRYFQSSFYENHIEILSMYYIDSINRLNKILHILKIIYAAQKYCIKSMINQPRYFLENIRNAYNKFLSKISKILNYSLSSKICKI